MGEIVGKFKKFLELIRADDINGRPVYRPPFYLMVIGVALWISLIFGVIVLLSP
jgi:hypothetical protein